MSLHLNVDHRGPPLDDSSSISGTGKSIYRSLYWEYLPEFFGVEDDPESLQLFAQLLAELEPLVVKTRTNAEGRVYKSPRESCVFSTEDRGFYGGLPLFDWSKSPTLVLIKEKIEREVGVERKFDYCLAHIYRNGKSNISWHNDREALNSEIASVSLGQTRKFRFRRMGTGSEWETEIKLHSGDLVWMKRGCQKTYQHSVPKEMTIKGCRINLTFRQFEDKIGSET